MTDASESSFVTCVKLVENHAPKFMASRHALTADERARLLRDGSIISIAPEMAQNHIATVARKKNFECAGFSFPKNVAACAEVLAIGDAIKHGDAIKVIRKHGANEQTVYRMIFKARKKPLPANNYEEKAQ